MGLFSRIFGSEGITLHNRGYDSYKSDRVEEAIIYYDKAIQVDPTLKEAWCNRGIALGRLKQYEEALVSYDRALQIDPNLKIARKNRELIINLKNKNPSSFHQLQIQRAIDYYKLGNHDLGSLKYFEAIASYDRALQIDPNFGGVGVLNYRNYREILINEKDKFEYGKIIHELIFAIYTNDKIINRSEIRDAFQINGHYIVTNWLEKGWGDKERRVKLLQYLDYNIKSKDIFLQLVQELIITFQYPVYNKGILEDPKNIEKMREIGQNLVDIEYNAVGIKDIDLMQVFHKIILVIDDEIASRLVWKWKGIGGWRP